MERPVAHGGDWTAGAGKAPSRSSLYGLIDTQVVQMDGVAKVDARGRLSAIGGTGRLVGIGPSANFAFSGRETTIDRCVELRDRFGGGDTQVVDGSGDTTTETRDVEGFSRVSISGVGTLLIDQTGEEGLTITAEDNILPRLRSDVVGDQLILGPEPNSSISPHEPIVYRLGVERLNELVVTGVTNVEIDGLESESFALDLSGVSNVMANGSVDSQHVVISGTSAYRAAGLASRNATVDITGLGEATLRVSRSLNGRVTGLGRLDYFGNPVVGVSVTGLGKVQKIGD